MMTVLKDLAGLQTIKGIRSGDYAIIAGEDVVIAARKEFTSRMWHEFLRAGCLRRYDVRVRSLWVPFFNRFVCFWI